MNPETLPIADDLFAFASEEPAGTGVHGEDEIRSLLLDAPLPLDRRSSSGPRPAPLQLAHANNKILSLSNSRTRILAHQVESTHRIVSSLNQRFIIADEVGLGRRSRRGWSSRSSYPARLREDPHHLARLASAPVAARNGEQVQRALRGSRPEVHPPRADPGRPRLEPVALLREGDLLADFIKNKSFAESLAASRWDAVIFDEAHRLRRDSQRSTLAYNVAEVLSRNTRSLLLLTATPFRASSRSSTTSCGSSIKTSWAPTRPSITGTAWMRGPRAASRPAFFRPDTPHQEGGGRVHPPVRANDPFRPVSGGARAV